MFEGIEMELYPAPTVRPLRSPLRIIGGPGLEPELMRILRQPHYRAAPVRAIR